MSYGFSRRPPFRILAAVDAEHAKPCEGFGRLDCNSSYQANIGVTPLERDIAELDPSEFLADLRAWDGSPVLRGELTALLCCPPCTDFSRAKPTNHSEDSPKNTLVAKCGDLVDALYPEYVLMENSRELITGNHPHHYRKFVRRLQGIGYDVRGDVHILTKFGLPQIRERALVVASRLGPARTLDDLWEGYRLVPGTTTVRHAIGALAGRKIAAGEVDTLDSMNQAPGFASDVVRRRIEAIPPDGGSWSDLVSHPDRDLLLTKAMKRRVAMRELGSHPDIYGRLAWDRPAVTIKRECAHVGNGRYCHPEQSRLLTVREMALLQGFPTDFTFPSSSMANRYRHIGDAVPPLISYQLSALFAWMKTGIRPEPDDWVLPGTSLKRNDITTLSHNEK